MTLKQWVDNGWLKFHETTPEEIDNLFQIVERDLKDARSGVSADWRFGIAYNAAFFIVKFGRGEIYLPALWRRI